MREVLSDIIKLKLQPLYFGRVVTESALNDLDIGSCAMGKKGERTRGVAHSGRGFSPETVVPARLTSCSAPSCTKDKSVHPVAKTHYMRNKRGGARELPWALRAWPWERVGWLGSSSWVTVALDDSLGSRCPLQGLPQGWQLRWAPAPPALPGVALCAADSGEGMPARGRGSLRDAGHPPVGDQSRP